MPGPPKGNDQSKDCPLCGETNVGSLPEHVKRRCPVAKADRQARRADTPDSPRESPDADADA